MPRHRVEVPLCCVPGCEAERAAQRPSCATHWEEAPALARMDYIRERGEIYRRPDPVAAARQAATRFGLAVRGFRS